MAKNKTVYKLTDSGGWTRRGESNALHWGDGVTHTATGTGGLCSAGVIHWYDNPELAALMDPIHGCYGAGATCWRASVTEVVEHDGTKGCSRSLTTLERVPLPVLTPTQRAEIAIRVSLLREPDLPEVYVTWARRWLDGTDRTAEAAKEVAKVARAETRAAKEVVRAAAWTTMWAAAEIVADVVQRMAVAHAVPGTSRDYAAMVASMVRECAPSKEEK